MTFETSKCTARRMAQGHLQKLIGAGLDVGAGDDPFRPLAGTCRPWDRKHGDGDATKLPGIHPNSFDYVYSSHCLEHLTDPVAGMLRWLEVVKPQGYLYVVVPDYDLYEGGQGIKNRFHRCAFSLNREDDPKVPLFNLVSLWHRHLKPLSTIQYLALCDENYDHCVGTAVDQTRTGATCHIELLLRKRMIG